MSSGLIYQLVGAGWIVYSLDHTDKTCLYYNDIANNPQEKVYYEEFDEEEHGMTYEEFMEGKLEHRVRDIKVVIDQIKLEYSSKLPYMNLSKLVWMGFCLGGTTAIEVARQYELDIKMCIAFDPNYYYAFKMMRENPGYWVKQPICIINASEYHNQQKFYNHNKVNQELFKACDEASDSKCRNIIIANTMHYNQWDLCLFMHFECTLAGLLPKNCDYPGKYMELAKNILDFMSEHDFLPIKTEIKKSKNNIRK